MNKESLYPTRRQKAFFVGGATEPQKYHIVVSASFMYFRYALRFIILLYIIIAMVSGFELLSAIMVTDVVAKAQIVPTFKALLMAILAGTMALMHNQILLIMGHGYLSRESQLHIDRLTLLSECKAGLSIIKSMYLFSVISSVVVLWILWGGYGTPFYNNQISEQLVAGTQVVAKLKEGFDAFEVNGMATAFKPFLWFTGLALVLAFFIGALGWIQATIARAKI